MGIKNRIHNFLFAGQDKNFFDSHKKEIHIRNSRMVGVLSIVITIVLLSFFVINFIREKSFSSCCIYLFGSIFFLFMHIIYKKIIRKHIVATNIYLNVILWALFLILLFLNIGNTSNSVYIPVFYVLLFSLVISAPVYTFISASISFVFYLIFVILVKKSPVVFTDIVNMITAFCIGVSIGWVILKERIHAIISKETISKMARQKESQLEAKSQFLSRMTHDIRTPINGVMGMTEIAKKNINNPQRIEDCLNKISIASEHLLSLVNDILDINRIENDNIQMMENSVNIKSLAESCFTIVENQIRERKIDFIKEFNCGEITTVICDELHLRQIFINILGNSLKYTPAGGKIIFKVDETPYGEDYMHYRFEFTDTGIGMPEEFLPHIWDAFSQVNINTGDSTGSGLGMAIAKSLVDKMGGNISVSSKLGEGSTFIVEITLRIETEIKQEEECLPEITLDGIKLLLVEDNQLNTEIALELLEEEGATVVCAENGVKALELFITSAEGEYDAILMDIIMPVMDGLEATKQIRALDRKDSKTIPIVAMTANAFESDEQKSIEAGMNAHLTKPLRIQQIKETLDELIPNRK